MEMAKIIIGKIIVMFFLVLVGYICARLGMIDPQTNKKLSAISLKLITPMLILASYQTEFEPRIIRNLFLSFALAALAFAIEIAGGFLLTPRKKNPDAAVERLCLMFPNCGYFGIPLVESLYGAEGAIYVTAAITFFNLLIWTVGDGVMSGRFSSRALLKGMLTPVTASIVLGLALMLLRVRLPELVLEPVRSIASMNTPFAMIVAGATLATTDLRSCVTEKRIYRVLVCKLLIIPAVVAVLLTRIPMEPMLVLIPIITAASPTAAACPMLAMLYEKNSPYASRIFAVTTLASILTIPLIVTVASAIL